MPDNITALMHRAATSSCDHAVLEQLYDRAARLGDWDLAANVAANPNTSEELVARLAEHDDHAVRICVMQRDDLDDDLFYELCTTTTSTRVWAQVCTTWKGAPHTNKGGTVEHHRARQHTIAEHAPCGTALVTVLSSSSTPDGTAEIAASRLADVLGVYSDADVRSLVAAASSDNVRRTLLNADLPPGLWAVAPQILRLWDVDDERVDQLCGTHVEHIERLCDEQHADAISALHPAQVLAACSTDPVRWAATFADTYEQGRFCFTDEWTVTKSVLTDVAALAARIRNAGSRIELLEAMGDIYTLEKYEHGWQTLWELAGAHQLANDDDVAWAVRELVGYRAHAMLTRRVELGYPIGDATVAAALENGTPGSWIAYATDPLAIVFSGDGEPKLAAVWDHLDTETRTEAVLRLPCDLAARYGGGIAEHAAALLCAADGGTYSVASELEASTIGDTIAMCRAAATT